MPRVRRRYIAFEVLGEEPVSEEQVARAITEAHLKFSGEQRFGRSSPRIISFDEQRQIGIVRSYLEGVAELRASLSLITRIAGRRVAVNALGMSGTLRACKDKFIRKTRPKALERVEKRYEEEDPGKLGELAGIKALPPGSVVRVFRKEFLVKRVFNDGRVDLESDEGSFGFTVLDLLGSSLGNEG